MKGMVKTLFVAAVAFGLGACAADAGDKGAAKEAKAEKVAAEAPKVMTADQVKKAFKSGANADWTAGDVKGEDAYFATVSTHKGDADRYIGAKTMQGSWEVKGDTLCTTFEGKEECLRLIESGKNQFKAIGTDGSTVRELKLKS